MVSSQIQNAPGVGPVVQPQPGMNIPLVALADPSGNVGAAAGAAPVGVSIAAGQTAIQNGTSVDLGTVKAFPCGVVTLAGVATGGTFQLQGSLDNTNWYNIGAAASPTSQLVTSLAAPTSAILPARFVRVQITATVTGTTAGALVGGA